MDKPLHEWQRRLRGMDDKALLRAWSKKADDAHTWTQEPGWYAAAAARMKQLGNMAIDLDDDTRKTLVRTGHDIVSRLEEKLAESHGDFLKKVRELHEERDEYDRKYGSRTARYYMYEQGMIDVLGDKKAVTAAE